MKKLTSNQVRQMWLDFFKSKNHHYVEPVSLVPFDDPSLLWINSGVATLKTYFDGRKNPPSPRLTNSQKSIRTNDIENVGVTARHQTMFEMLGNFSIGDYFKKEAIHFGWELLTAKEWFDMDKELLYITVFEEDEEAYNVWTKEIGIKPDHIFKGTRETNFWDVGQGPCGPNTEIFFDRGEKWDPEKIGPRLLKDDIENDRYIEVWNIVFSQFNNDGNNNYTELPRKNIDTGAGLERLVSIFQETPTNFETDLFLPTIKKIEQICDSKFKYKIENYQKPNLEQTKINTAFKVIADHIRASSFAIADGVFPSNKDRGYIIRRLLRRSVVYGIKLGIKDEFLYKLVDNVIESMGTFYTYLKEKRDLIIETIKTEESKFLLTLLRGVEHLEKIISNNKIVSGESALLLFESFGFPIELTLELANEKDTKVDIKKFEELLEFKKELSRDNRKEDIAWNKQSKILTSLDIKSEFIGYESEESKSKVEFIFSNDQELKSVKNKEVFVILDKTPFYAEKGGQASDDGNLFLSSGEMIPVVDVQEGPNHQNIHRVLISSSELKKGDVVEARINSEKRRLTMKNHSGTHIIHSAIRQILGDASMQTGSFNNENGLRIDVTSKTSPTPEQIKEINKLCLKHIKLNHKREVIFTSLKDAVEKYNALAFFGDKYDKEVRVVRFSEFSCELCGGTHVEQTSDIEDLLITKVESKGSGVFRFHAITSHEKILNYVNSEFDNKINELRLMISKYSNLEDNVLYKNLFKLYSEIKNIKRTKDNLEQLKDKDIAFRSEFKIFAKQAESLMIESKIEKYKLTKPVNDKDINRIELIANDLSMNEMKYLTDVLKQNNENLISIIFNEIEKIIVVSVSNNITNKFSAIEIFNSYKKFKTKGGGNAQFAQGKIID